MRAERGMVPLIGCAHEDPARDGGAGAGRAAAQSALHPFEQPHPPAPLHSLLLLILRLTYNSSGGSGSDASRPILHDGGAIGDAISVLPPTESDRLLILKRSPTSAPRRSALHGCY